MAHLTRRTPLYGAYLLAVTALAVLGGVYENPAFYLAAVALALPCGIIALIAIYMAYPLLVAVFDLLGSARTPTGDDVVALTATRGAVNAVLLLGAALVNVMVLERWLSFRRARRAASPEKTGV